MSISKCVQVVTLLFITLGMLNGHTTHAQELTNHRYLYAVQETNTFIAYSILPDSGQGEERFRVDLGTHDLVDRHVKLSPDGQWLAYLAKNIDNQRLVAVMDITQQNISTVMTDDFWLPLDDSPTLTWSPDSNHLLIHTYVPEDSTYSFHHFYLYNPYTSQINRVVPPSNNLISTMIWSQDGQNLFSVQFVCGTGTECVVTGSLWDVDSRSVIETYTATDFASLGGEGLCELSWTSDKRFIARMESCVGGALDIRREVHVYDTSFTNGKQVTSHTEGAGLFGPRISAKYSLHWSNNEELLIGLEHQNPAEKIVQTLRYSALTDTMTVIDNRSGEDWVSSHNQQYVAYRTVNDFERSAYSARIVDDSTSQFEVIYEQSANACSFAWSSDDRWLAYTNREFSSFTNLCYLDITSINFVDMQTMQTYTVQLTDHTAFIPLGWIE